MGVSSETFSLILLKWACDAPGCGEVEVLPNPSPRDRIEGPPGWRRVGREVRCPACTG